MKKIYIGNTPDGVPVVMDIAQMPHLLRRLRRLWIRRLSNTPENTYATDHILTA
jgi:hypothetical protein